MPRKSLIFLGKQLRNPIGLAAGFDKNGEAIRPLAEWSGFGLIEIGTVTPIPQQGNPRPRVFRLLEDEGIINRCGSNSDGVGRVQQRVKAARDEWNDNLAMLGVNIGKNMLCDEAKLDFEIGVNYFAAYSDYVVINVSSPSTPNLRSMQKKSGLQNLLTYVKHAIDVMELNPRPKLLLKIAPDLTESEKKDIAQVVLDSKYGIDGLIVTNTTIARPDSLRSANKVESGGLSGAPLREMSTECVREMYRFTNGRVPIVGCGGVSSGADAYEKIRAGASVVQLYSALAYHGFPVVGKVCSNYNQFLPFENKLKSQIKGARRPSRDCWISTSPTSARS
ncbi:dihydroorotate oxidase [Cooperia oncophora]